MDNTNLSPPQPNILTQGRRASYSKTSSATCSNAKSNEDWRGITDLTERRRVQNRIAQRNYREKQKRRQQQATGLDESVSPGPTDALVGAPVSSPGMGATRWSTGQANSLEYAPLSQTIPYLESDPMNYIPGRDNQFSAVNEPYLRPPMTLTSTSYSNPAYSQLLATSCATYHQSTDYTDLAAQAGRYANTVHQSQNAVDGPHMTSTSRPLIAPVIPTRQGDGYPSNNVPLDGIDFTQPYDNLQTYAQSTSFVNDSDFLRQNHPPL